MGSPRILVTSDDGIRSPGLRAAVEVLLDLGEVTVVAPVKQQTSMGRSYHAIVVERIVSVTPVSLDITSRINPDELERVLKKIKN